MFETAITDGTEKLRLQEKVAETGRVNTHVRALFVDGGSGSEVALLAIRSSSGLCSVELFV